jgi:hypothetical protein
MPGVSARLIIAVVGCRAYFTRLATVRASWATQAHDDVEIVYVVGRGGTAMPDWVTELDAPDDYEGLPIKVHALHRWLRDRDFAWLFKCDDDSFVVVDRVLAVARGMAPGVFLGAPDFHPNFAGGGAGYIMTRDASRRLADDPEPAPGPEDVHYSHRLIGLGYEFRATSRLRHRSRDEDLPRPGNDIATCHWMSPLRLRERHDDMAGIVRDPALAQAHYAAEHDAWRGELALFDDGFFTGGSGSPDGLWRLGDDRLWLDWFSWPSDMLERHADGWRNAQLALALTGGRFTARAEQPLRRVRPA